MANHRMGNAVNIHTCTFPKLTDDTLLGCAGGPRGGVGLPARGGVVFVGAEFHLGRDPRRRPNLGGIN